MKGKAVSLGRQALGPHTQLRAATSQIAKLPAAQVRMNHGSFNRENEPQVLWVKINFQW